MTQHCFSLSTAACLHFPYEQFLDKETRVLSFVNWQDLRIEVISIDNELSHSFLQGNCLSSAPAAVGEHTAISWRVVLYSHFPPQDALCAAAIPLLQIYLLLQADPLPLSCSSWRDLVRFMLADHIALRLGNAGILLLRGSKRTNLLHHLYCMRTTQNILSMFDSYCAKDVNCLVVLLLLASTRKPGSKNLCGHNSKYWLDIDPFIFTYLTSTIDAFNTALETYISFSFGKLAAVISAIFHAF